MVNEDDAYIDSRIVVQYSACGQLYRGACKADMASTLDPPTDQPTCRAPLMVSHEAYFKRLRKLVHGRSAGRHTPVAQNSLGFIYKDGKGVDQNVKEAAECYKNAAEQVYAMA